MEKWFVMSKKADFERLGALYGISPVTARLIRNRDVVEEEAFYKYLKGSISDLYNPHLLKDVELLTDTLTEKIKDKNVRFWYANEAANGNWSKVILEHQIDMNLYERKSLLNKNNNFENTLVESSRTLVVNDNIRMYKKLF